MEKPRNVICSIFLTVLEQSVICASLPPTTNAPPFIVLRCQVCIQPRAFLARFWLPFWEGLIDAMVSPSRISTLLLVASTTVLLLVKIPGSLAQGGGGGGGGSGGGAGGSTSSESLGEECDTTGLDADYSERLMCGSRA